MGKFKILILILVVFGSLYTAFSFLILPGIAHAKVMSALSAAGLDTSLIQRPSAGFDFILYRDVAIDKDKFSTIKSVRAIYDPYNLLVSGKFSALEINGLDITGDWSDENYSSFAFVGWTPPLDLSKLPFQNFRDITLNKTTLSFLTQKAGGFVITLDLTGAFKDGKIEFQGRLSTNQPYLTLASTVKGFIEGPHWSVDLDIEEGKFEDPAGKFKAMRMNGSINMASLLNQPLKISSELRAGGATIMDLPWQNLSGTVEYADGAVTIFTEGKSVGQTGLELEMTFEGPGIGPLAGQGSIHAEKSSDLVTYLKSRKKFEPLLSDVKKVTNLEDMIVSFQFIPLNTLTYEAIHGEKTLDIKGELKL